jgi:hypothetical protein
MDAVVHIAGVLLLLAVCAVSVLSLLFGLPGTWVMVAAALLYGWATDFAAVQWSTIGWLALLAGAGEGVEFIAASAATARERPSRRVSVGAIIGSIAGAIVGTPLLFGIGSLIGALAGAFAGAAMAVAWEGATPNAALRTGLAAMRGRLLGFVLKTAIAVGMVIVVIGAL